MNSRLKQNGLYGRSLYFVEIERFELSHVNDSTEIRIITEQPIDSAGVFGVLFYR